MSVIRLRRLGGEEIAAVNRVVKCLAGESPSPFVLTRRDAALSTDRMRTLDRNDRDQIDSCPAAASFIAAARPASPPPTIANFIFVAAIKCVGVKLFRNRFSTSLRKKTLA